MKGKSLFKKIAAAATTVAMLASVSVVGFAVEDSNGPEDGDAQDFVSTGKVTGSVSFDENDAGTAFDFTVSYTQNTTDNIGVTMLAYKVSNNEQIADGYTGTGANVVGIGQMGKAEATKQFTFSVDKVDNANDTDRSLEYGDEVIVLLSSDGAANAVGYLKKITGTTDEVVLNGTTFEVELPYYEATDAAKVKAAIEDTDNLSVNVKIGEGTTEDVENVGVTAVGTPVFADDAWTVEVTLEEITGTNLSAAAGAKVTVPVTVTKQDWVATSATMANDVIPYDANSAITDPAAMLAAITAKAKASKITFVGDDEHSVLKDVPANATVDWKGDAPTTITQGGEYTVTVTLAEALTLDDEVATAPQGMAADFTVTYQQDTRKEAALAKAFLDTTEVTEIADYTFTEGETKTAADLLTYVQGKIDTYKVYDDADPANEGAATAAWKLYSDAEGQTEVTDATALVADTKYYAIATVTPSDSENWKGTTVELTFEVTATAAPDVVYGDLNDDGRVMAYDVAQAFLASKNKVQLTDKQKKAADVATAIPDGRIMAADVAQIFLKSKNKIDKFPVEK